MGIDLNFTIRAKQFLKCPILEDLGYRVRSKTTDYSAEFEVTGLKRAWIVPNHATGIWAGLDGNIAIWMEVETVWQWVYAVPEQDWTVFVVDEPFEMDLLQLYADEDVFQGQVQKKGFISVEGFYIYSNGIWVRIQKSQTVIGMVQKGRFNYNVPYLRTSGIVGEKKPWVLIDATPIGRVRKTVEEFTGNPNLNSTEVIRGIQTNELFIQNAEVCSDDPQAENYEEALPKRVPFATTDGVLSTFPVDTALPASFIRSNMGQNGERIFFCQDTDLVYRIECRKADGGEGSLDIPLFSPDGVLQDFSPDDSGFMVQLLIPDKLSIAEPEDDWNAFTSEL